MAGLCSALASVDPTSIRLTSAPSSTRRTALVILFAGLLLLALGILAAVSFHR
jgi:hypothetical protein